MTDVVSIKKTPITDKQIIGWGIIIVVQAFALGGTYYSMKSGLENAASKSSVEKLADRFADRFADMEESKGKSDKDLSEMRAILNPLPFQLSQMSAAITDASRRADLTDQRLDKFNDQFSGKLDALAETMNTIRVDVARIAASSRDRSSPPQPASFKP